MEYMLVGQLSYALTDSYSFSAIAAGMIFLLSRFFDGFTDIIAGFIIDRLNPECGKARIYDLLHVPMWILLVLVFSVPDIGMTGKFVWVFLFYNLLQSVTTTFMNVAEPLRLQRSVREEHRMSVMRTTSMMTLVFGYIGGFALPILISIFEDMEHGWTIIGLIFGGVMICWAMYNTVTQTTSTYYFTHVYGNVSAASFVALPGMLSVVFVAFVPKIIEKLGKENTVRTGLLATAIVSFAKLLCPYSIVGLGLLSLAASCGIMCLGFMKQLLNIDCITYGKLKTKSNVEAAYSTVNSVADKIGLGLGSMITGVILQLGGYDGDLEVQSASTVFTIKMVYAVVPAVLMVIALIFFAFYHAERDIAKLQAAEEQN